MCSSDLKSIRDCESSLGTGDKIVQREEQELRKFAQRAIQATKLIRKGEIFREGENIDILRPGKQKQGLHPKYLTQIINKTAKRNIQSGQGITKADYE